MVFLPALLSEQKGKQFIGTNELASVATAIILNMGTPQERGTVKSVVDERTVRYYQSEGLIETPTEKKGPASIYNYSHLLSLIAIKRLQSQDLPIRKIRRIIRGMSEPELENLIEETPTLSSAPSEARSEARQYLDQISRSAEWEPRDLESDSESSSPRMSKPPARFFESDKDFEIKPLADMISPLLYRSSMNTMSALPEEGENWKKFEIIPGIELHVREDAGQTLDPKTRIVVLKKIEQIIRFFTDR